MGHRTELLAAAVRLLETKGYAHITTRDLVAESGTNLASIGYHFGSKAGLLNAAIAVVFQDWTDQLARQAMAEPAALPLERARITWAAVIDSFAERRPLLLSYVEALAQAERTPEVREQFAEQFRRCRAQVAELVVRSLDRSLPDGSPQRMSEGDPRASAIASFVMAVCDGLAVQFLIDPEGVPSPQELTDGLAAVWVASNQH